MNIKLGRDVNGNKILKVSFVGVRGFSVQTLGNLPETHRMPSNEELRQFTAVNELHAFIKIYGTKRQKELLGW